MQNTDAREMTVTITKKGEVSFSNFKGTVGSECEEMTKDLEAALGKTSFREHTDAYYKSRDVAYEQEGQY